MAARNDIKAGRAYVELSLKRNLFTQGLKAAMVDLQKFGTAMMAIGSSAARVGAGMMAMGGVVVAAFASPIRAASNFVETVSKFGSVFGESTDEVRAWADAFRKQVGRAESDVLNSLATFQSFFLGLGFGAEEAKKLSQEMSALSVDFGSFHNVADAEAAQRFISALSGSGEVLSMFGVNLFSAALDAKLLELGFKSVAKGATEAEKAMARVAIIRSTMNKQNATGDAVRTSGSFSNLMKSLMASVSDVSIAIGNALIPALTPFVKLASDAGKVIAAWIEENKQIVVAIAGVAAGVAAAGAVLAGMGLTMAAVGAAITGTIATLGAFGAAASAAFALIVNPVTLVGAAVAGGAAAFLTFSQTARDAVSAVASAIYTFLEPAINFISMVGKSMAQAFAAGDIAGAFQVGLAAANVVLQEFILFVSDSFYSIKQIAIDAWNEISAQAQGAFAGLLKIYETVGVNVPKVWSAMIDGVQAVGESIAELGSIAYESFTGMRDNIVAFVQAMSTIVPSLHEVAAAMQETTDTSQAAKDRGKAAFDKARSAVGKGIGNIASGLQGIGDARQEAIDAARARGMVTGDKNREAAFDAHNDQSEAIRQARINLAKARADVDERARYTDPAAAKEAIDTAVAKTPAAMKSAMGGANGTFSAMAAILGSRGPEDKVVKTLKENQKETLKKFDKQIDAFKNANTLKVQVAG